MTEISLKAQISIKGLREDKVELGNMLEYLIKAVETPGMYDDLAYFDKEILRTMIDCENKLSDLWSRISRIKHLIENGNL